MTGSFRPRFGAVLVFLTALAALVLGGPARAQDMPGAKDHPLLKRFAGSTLVGYDHKRFDEYVLPTGTYLRYDTSVGKPVYASTLPIEGAVTRLWYEAAGDASATELVRNYENEIVANGGSVLYDSGKDPAFKNRSCVLCRFGKNDPKNVRSSYVFYSASADTARFASYRVPRPQGDLYVHITAVQWAGEDRTYKARKGAYAAVDIVEIAAMKQNMVTVSADEMSKSIAATGKVALYGILFDTGKADIKAESKAALEEIAKLLKADPQMKLRVVGHTDNQGTLDANIALSKRRAEAVNAALAAQHGIAASRLAGYGVADLAPVASNRDEAGRAKNRRVELVPQ